ncbi:MAG: hypothetical protein V1859_04605 [archaeon]
MLVICIGVFGFFYIKKPQFRSKVNNGAKKGADGFKTHCIPFVKKAAKKTAEVTVKAAKFTAHHVKIGMNNAAPHVKKIGAKIKETTKKTVSRITKKNETKK